MVDHSAIQRILHAVREADPSLGMEEAVAIAMTLHTAPVDLLWLVLAERGVVGEDRFMLHGQRVVRRYEREVREK